MKFSSFVSRFIHPLRRDDHGATAVEYALIVVLIGIASVVALTQLGTALKNVIVLIARTIVTATGAI